MTLRVVKIIGTGNNILKIFYSIIFILFWLIWLYHLVLDLKLLLLLRSLQGQFKVGHDLMNYLIKGGYREGQLAPRYKFFSELIEELVKARREFGCEIEKSILEIRKYLRLDIKETKRIRESIITGAYQYILLISFTWFFLVSSNEILKINLILSESIGLALFQLLGLILYFKVAIFIRLRMFCKLNSYFFSIYTFRTLFSISRPLTEILLKSRITELKDCKELVHIHKRINILVKEFKVNGTLNLDDLNQVVMEIWDCFELKLESFKRFISALKFTSMILFILPSFLWVMLKLMTKLQL